MALKLVILEKKYQRQLTEMLDEWTSFNNANPSANTSPWAIFKNDYHDIDNYIKNLYDNESLIKAGRVPATTFFLYDDERDIFIGAANIRHYLNEDLLKGAGHIGDGIRPSERRKGYATKLIALALEECKKMGIDRVMMACDVDNIGSKKSIIKNGGVLDEVFIGMEGNPEERYWIENK